MKVKARPTPPTDGVIKSLGHLVQKADGAASGPMFRITSDVLDRHRDRVRPDALKTENYLKNPVLLWNHNDWEPAIGTCRVFQEGDEWFMEPSFDGIGELSKDVAAKVAAGTLRTCSIRFRFLKYAYNEDGGLDYEEVELLEVSITNIPANPEAVRVKTRDAQKNTREHAEPQPQEEAKALEDADLKSIGEIVKAAVAESLAPTIKILKALSSTDRRKNEEEPGEEEKDEEEEEPDEGDGDSVEMSEEDADELKTFLQKLSKKT